MLEQKDHFHGSDLEKIESIYGIKKEEIISFSANVNPLGISYRLREELPKHLDAITSYPDREYTALRKSISNYVQADVRNIIVGNGSTELISLVIQWKHPKKALLIAPSYSEYEHEITMTGGVIQYFRLKESQDFNLDTEALLHSLTPDIDLLVICNPNNPTSSQITRETLREIIGHCRENDIFVMIDETYVEFSESYETINAIPLTRTFNNMIVLRGISKFFASPGLRLGYAVCGNSGLMKEIEQAKHPWSINSLASIAGEIMFQDTAYIQDTINLISGEKTRICNILDTCPQIKYYPPHANFILLRILKADVTGTDIFEQAIRKGLMLRDCSTFPFLDNKYLRFCFMKPADNDALLEVILSALS